MGNIFFTSDLHFGHDREFVWGPRGFKSVEEMNEIQLERFNEIVKPEDTIYILEDSMLGIAEIGQKYFSALNGHKHIILGNHDTNSRIEFYKSVCESVTYADVVKLGKKRYYLSHFPTLTANLDANPHEFLQNLYGHTHQQHNFYEDRPYMYHVGVDSHNCYPVALEEIQQDVKNKITECLAALREEE